ncbi:V-type ATP synthase subunit E [Candidatus Bathyarchaeota archaeon]|nr:V-type ATP synthase subunit E [Candidatus Bathyarchaeota archaeon]
MSQDKLENQLIDKTIQQRNDLLEAAKQKAAKSLSNAEAEKLRIEDLNNKAIENIIGSELRAVHDRIVGGAQLQGRKVLMEARAEVIENVFVRTAEEIESIVKSPEYNGYLIKLVQMSVQKLGEECIVYANEKDLAYLKENMEQFAVESFKVKLEKSPVDLVGGVTIMNLNGTKTIHNTLDSRLKEAKRRLAATVAEKLGVI